MAGAAFEASSENQIQTLLSGFSPAPLKGKAAAERDYDLAARLDKKGDAFSAAGNKRMAKICRQRALMACVRADRHAAE